MLNFSCQTDMLIFKRLWYRTPIYVFKTLILFGI